ncbi:MAG: hypothetical protein GEU28_06270 [Dehalococcoidia bacterium]|nr:hypothetical protein [Dehalococcoidia bacterium]
MYGTVARMKIKPGKLAELQRFTEESDRARGGINGAIAYYVFQSDRDPDEMVLAAIFESKEAYRANAEDPKQDEWYQQMRQMLQGDPEWDDGEIVIAQTFAGSR